MHNQMKQPVVIKPVNSANRVNTFMKYPWLVYKDNPHWVPPLLMQLKRQLNLKVNPFFANGEMVQFLAFRGTKCVGRIAAIINEQHNRHYNEQCGFFGFFECDNDQEVSNKLFDVAEKWLREKGMTIIRGPVNLATHAECGLLVDGYDGPPSLQMPYNLNYYDQLISGSGYSRETDLLAYELGIGSVAENGRYMKMLDRVVINAEKNKGISFRKFNVRNFDAEVERIRMLFNDYMQDNWGFVPLTREEFRFLAEDMKPLLEPDLALFAEHEGIAIGFAIALPNINQVLPKLNGKLFPLGIFKYFYYKRSINQARVALLGVSKAYRGKGLEAWFYKQLIEQGRRRGIHSAELSWISEHNKPMLHAVEHMGAKLYRRYRIYSRTL